MKTASFSQFFLCLLVAVWSVTLDAWAGEQLYTCGMHPQIIKKEPGNCPICGMTLTPLHGAGTQAADGKFQIDPATVQRMNIRTDLVRRGPVKREIRTLGVVAYNEEGFTDVSLKYEGWIEKMHVNATWSTVKAGDPLFDVYSPDLYNAEINYVTATRAENAGDGPLSKAAMSRLRLFDVPDEFIAELKRSGEPKRTFTYRAPIAGVITEKMAVPGQMMKPGERIYRLADLSTVWVEAQIYEKDLAFVKPGASAKVHSSYGPEQMYEGNVRLVLPQVQEQTRSAIARIVLPNTDGSLRPGMYVDVDFAVQLSADAPLVPDTAVLRSGESNTVFLALDDGFFEPRTIELGARSEGNFYQVLSGLQGGEKVVISGQFMLDSESQLREAVQKMIKGNSSPSANPSTSAAPSPASGQEAMLYTCPMPEHADVVQDHPGKCPKCGMKLVPTTEVEHGQQAEETWRQQHSGHSHH